MSGATIELTAEHQRIVGEIRRFTARFGRTPTKSDWSVDRAGELNELTGNVRPSQHNGAGMRSREQIEAGPWPTIAEVEALFGSWSKAIELSGGVVFATLGVEVHAAPGSLEDVEDVAAFATWIAERQFRDDNYVAIDEARAQAVLLIYELYHGSCANKVGETPEGKPIVCGQGPVGCTCPGGPNLKGGWDPKRCPKFSAYLLTYLPRRLIGWWKRELRQSGRGTWAGSRGEYVYYRTTSFDEGNVDQAVWDRDE